jgi:hypothetical protein
VAYNPATNNWRRLSGTFGGSIWNGRQVLGWGGGCYGAVEAEGTAYTPATDTLRRLPPMPEPRAGATATWIGTEVLVVGGFGPSSNVRPHVRLYTDGVAYNPSTNRWRHLPAMGDTGRTEHTATWTGRQLLVWGGRTLRAGSWTTPRHGVAYDPGSNRWSALPRSVLRGRTGHVAVWTGTQMLIWGGNAVTPGGPSPMVPLHAHPAVTEEPPASVVTGRRLGKSPVEGRSVAPCELAPAGAGANGRTLESLCGMC